MLSLMIISSVLLSVVHTAPVYNSQPPAQIIDYQYDNLPNAYKFHYDATDGSSRTEEGAILDPGTKNAALDVKGSVRWYNDKGHLYEMTYKAGKRGYRTIIRKLS